MDACAANPDHADRSSAILRLRLTTDAMGQETTWEIVEQGTMQVMWSGGPLAPYASIDQFVSVPDGCYELRVYDAGGDGMTSGTIGGYILTSGGSKRIIDNTANGIFGNLSTIANGQGFCLPLGDDHFTAQSCDKLDWRPNQYIVADDDFWVSEEWWMSSTGHEDDGYEIWFFDPNGGYSFRKYQGGNTPNGLSPGPTRPCHFKINNWVGNQLQPHVLYNVRVRSRLNGVNDEWGSACRFKIDEERAQCPLTQLLDWDPGVPGHGENWTSCDAWRYWGNGNYLWARPVTRLNSNGVTVAANKYQFRFRPYSANVPPSGPGVVRTTNNYFVQLNWAQSPLVPSYHYWVDVRASFDHGATWCTDYIPPVLLDPWGTLCPLEIATPMNGGGQRALQEQGAASSPVLQVFPNPNRGDRFTLGLDAVAENVRTVTVEVYDALGARTTSRTLPVNNGFVNAVVDLERTLANGLYTISVTCGDRVHTTRMLVQP